jgi:hypothetical protein
MASEFTHLIKLKQINVWKINLILALAVAMTAVVA